MTGSSSRFFGRPRGRFFSVRDEQRRIDRDMELYQNVYGTEMLWFFYVPTATTYDDVYDEGSVTSGKSYSAPLRVPVLSAQTSQANEQADDQGFATYDRVQLRMSYDQVRRAGLDRDLVANREKHLLDRFVWRGRVYDVETITTAGHFDPASLDMVLYVAGVQLRPDELVDSPAFAAYVPSRSDR